MQKAYILAGANLGDRRANIKFAIDSLKSAGQVRKVSSFFETEPVGYQDQPWFLNLAVELETDLMPLELLSVCKKIEDSCGRVRTFLNAPRTLDVDILLIADIVMSEPGLTVPHPRMEQRRFVLAPLAQIAPGLMHPVLKKTIQTLLDECRDTSEIRLV